MFVDKAGGRRAVSRLAFWYEDCLFLLVAGNSAA